MRRVTQSLLEVAVSAALLVAAPALRADDDPVKSLTLILEGACDPKNSRLFIESKHPSKTIVATIRWNLAGSKRIASDQFQVAPSGRVEVGCAAQADIVTATFVE